MTKSVAIYAGSFDPITKGHEDIVERVAAHLERLVVVVADSSSKQYWFSSQARVQLAQESFRKLGNVEVVAHSGLVADFAQRVGAKLLIRGLRAVSDFESEWAMSNINRELWSELETVIVLARPAYQHLSSRMIKEVALHGGNISGMVSPHVDRAIMSFVKGKK